MTDEATVPDFDALWDYTDPAGTEARFRALLPAVADAPGPRLELQTQVARTQGLQSQFAAAHTTLDAVAAALTDDLPRPRIRYLLERGRVVNSAGDPAGALPWFQQALDLATAQGEDFLAVDAAHMLGIAAPPPEARAWNERALAMAQASADARARGWQGSLYNNLGWSCHDAGQYAEALALFEQGLAACEAAGQVEKARFARWTVARALRSLDRYEEALAGQRALEVEDAACGSPDADVAEEIGECLLALGRPAEARPYFARAIALFHADPWFPAGDRAHFARLQTLAGDSPALPAALPQE